MGMRFWKLRAEVKGRRSAGARHRTVTPVAAIEDEEDTRREVVDESAPWAGPDQVAPPRRRSSWGAEAPDPVSADAVSSDAASSVKRVPRDRAPTVRLSELAAASPVMMARQSAPPRRREAGRAARASELSARLARARTLAAADRARNPDDRMGERRPLASAGGGATRTRLGPTAADAAGTPQLVRNPDGTRVRAKKPAPRVLAATPGRPVPRALPRPVAAPPWPVARGPASASSGPTPSPARPDRAAPSAGAPASSLHSGVASLPPERPRTRRRQPSSFSPPGRSVRTGPPARAPTVVPWTSADDGSRAGRAALVTEAGGFADTETCPGPVSP